MARLSSTSASTSGTSARDRDGTSDSARDSTSTRELEIIEKFLHPYHLLVHKVQIYFCHLVVLEIELVLVTPLEIALVPGS